VGFRSEFLPEALLAEELIFGQVFRLFFARPSWPGSRSK